MSNPDYQFTPVTEMDFPMLRRWLATPEVRKWWGDPDAELGLIREDLDENRMINLIVGLDGHPFAYVQHYEVHSWPQAHLSHLPSGCRAIDTFVGDPKMLGAGHAPAYLRQLASSLLAAGAPEVVIDPVADNARAVRAYEKAGFSRIERHESADETVMLMFFEHNSQ